MTSPAGDGATRLTIGALSTATGIRATTLRAWEARYGFPSPERTASGHRLYPIDTVPRLKAVSELLARGHRAAQVVPAVSPMLEALFGACPIRKRETGRSVTDAGDLLDVVESFNGALLQSSLHAEAASLGIVDFLETRVSPLLVALSGARRTRRIGLRHERFAHERLSSVLHGLRSSLAPREGLPQPFSRRSRTGSRFDSM